jgi:formate hydrogenlyase subunit 6/NADH:ubiquinone oxidoreductase subunit I
VPRKLNGGNQPNVYFARALDRSFVDAYIKKRIEKENKNATFPGFIVDTCQNCVGCSACVLAAAAPPSVKLLKLPKIANN